MGQNESEYVATNDEEEATALPAKAAADQRALTLVAQEAQPPEEPPQPNAAANVLLHAIQRLESVIDEEIMARQQRQKVDFDTFSRRKNRGLLELVRSSKAAGESGRNAEVTAEVVKLRAKLEQNYTILRLHFEAVRAVSELICRTIREAESDGTYVVASRRKE
jgi:hypothetical protein